MIHTSTLKSKFKKEFGTEIKIVNIKKNIFLTSIKVSKEMPRSTKKGITFCQVNSKGNLIFDRIDWF